ncbi:MetQ/NlpA family ABC transporter substrate-binding protein [Clostridium sp. MSJ-4]|uniref:Lipoprotein n=1 Tax=Clostridium simiarum TaxID=2841506 RepID=A0ABS6F265_9CLOT|nr:MetQ/NlpA family ABC transporter substrate-binding protein [Clostridium simiarum]MBU5592376.1 MetQ/NlpA family ABC transporter substrate-binding protein [Clostridium simiarum]
MKKITTLLTSLLLVSTVFVGCSAKDNSAEGSSDKNKTIKVGATPLPHAEILQEAKKILEKDGYNLEIVEFTDYVTPNTSLSEKEIDANFFQHVPYLEKFNKERNTKLDYTAKIHLEPLGLYSKKLKDISEIKDGAEIAIPNDPTNGARSLKLLQDKSLIKLKDVELATVNDIIENPKQLKIQELEAPQLPRVLQDVDIAVINTNYALEADLSPLKDALAIESKDSPYANILAVREDNKDSEGIKALTKALTSSEIKKFIEDKYKGAIVPSF